MDEIELILDPESQLVTVNDESPTISVQWDQAVQQAVINTAPGPTIASRAYAILHTAMFDAWATYDPNAIATQLGSQLQRPEAENTEANKTEAMSFAAYRVLTELFPSEQSIFDDLMAELGFDTSNTTTDTTTATGIGNVAAETLMEFRRQDGSNQLNDYVDTTGYEAVNNDSDNIIDIARWTPEFVPIDSDGNQQQFLTPQWSVVEPFALDSASAVRPVEPEPFLLVEGATVDLDAQTITLADGSVVDINLDIVGTNADEGAIINQAFIDQTERVIEASANLTDEQKLIAEFWEDGGGTSFPPGTFMTFGQFVSARDDNSLDDDVALFFALSNAVFDAGVATWEAKVFYDYTRPVRLIRELGELGLLNDGTVGTDAITGETGFVIEAWAGPGLGTQTILADNFLTYQTPGSDPSPPFAEYTSGHSAFSAAGAEVLQLFTGSDDFGASVTFEAGESRFEPDVTPIESVTLEWETFTEAADEAGISRIYGGIHFDDGDLNGRTLGTQVGESAWELTQLFVNGDTLPTFINEVITAELEENAAAGTIVATLSLVDLDSNFDQVTITGGNEDQNGDGDLPFELGALTVDEEDSTRATVEVLVNDPADIDFEAISAGEFDLEFTITDTDAQEGTTTLAIEFADVENQLGFDENSAAVANGILTLTGDFNDEDEADPVLQLTINQFLNQDIDGNVHEFGIFVVDDNDGAINAIQPNDDDYLNQVFNQIAAGTGEVIFSTLAFQPDGFDPGDINRYIEASGTRLGFFLVVDGTVDDVLEDIEGGLDPSNTVLFSTLNENLLESEEDKFSLSFSGDDDDTFDKFSIDVDVINVEDSQEDELLTIANLQGDEEGEVLDLREITSQASVTVNIFREAGFDSLIGFYSVSDTNGTLDGLTPGADGFDQQTYVQTALSNRITTLDLLSTSDQSTTTITGEFEPGSILAPFIVVDGSLNDALNGDAEVYFPYLNANSDGSEHIRLLGTNVFGFEDLANGGDNDFNDLVVELNFTIA